jgi:hypothetical protein
MARGERLKTPSPNAAMWLWGAIVAALAVLVLLTITPKVWPMEDWRGIKLRESMAILKHGGPLLLGSHGPPNGSYYAIDLGDDEGVYVYIPLLSRLFGVAEPVSMVRDLYIALLALGALIYPMIFYRLTRSRLAALAAPLMFLVCVMSLGFVDLYWVPAWGALVLLPLIFLLVRDWPRFGYVALVAIAFAASWMTSIRSYSGLGIAIAAAVVLVLRGWRWWRLLPALAVLAVAYVSINTFIFSGIRAERDHWLGAAAQGLDLSSSHALWGEAYAGLGYLPNKFGLRYLDSGPDSLVQSIAPGTLNLSSRYEAVIRKAYLDFTREHPMEAARQYAAKIVVTAADTTPYLLIVALTLPAMLLLTPQRRVVRRWLLLVIPSAIIEFVPPILALPRQSYEEGIYGVIGVVGILGLCLWLERVEIMTYRHRGASLALDRARISWRQLARSSSRRARSTRFAIVAVVAVSAVAAGGYPLRREANRWQQQPSGVLMEHLVAGRPVFPTELSLTGIRATRAAIRSVADV